MSNFSLKSKYLIPQEAPVIGNGKPRIGGGGDADPNYIDLLGSPLKARSDQALGKPSFMDADYDGGGGMMPMLKKMIWPLIGILAVVMGFKMFKGKKGKKGKR